MLDTKAIEARLAAANEAWDAAERADKSPDMTDVEAGRIRDAEEDAAWALYSHAPADIAALLAEVARLREALTVTPEKIEAAIQARNDYIWRDGGIHAPTESGELRAALLAAGMTADGG